MTTTNELRDAEILGLLAAASTTNLNFELHNTNDLLVTEVIDATDVETVMVRGTNYSVTIGTNGIDPVVTNITEIAAGSRWRIRRISKAFQNLNLSGTKLPFESVEDALDRLTHFWADSKGELDRCIKHPDGDATPSGLGKLDTVTTRKGKFLGFDATTGDVISVNGSVASSVTFTPDGETLVGSALAAMKTFLGIFVSPTTTRGDLLTESAAPGVLSRIAAPTRTGQFFGTARTIVPDKGSPTVNEPAYYTPRIHPMAHMNGLVMVRDASVLTRLRISGGVTTPFTDNGVAGSGYDYAVSDVNEIRHAHGVGSGSGMAKVVTTAWASGINNGGLVAGAAIGNDDDAYVYALSNSTDLIGSPFDVAIDDVVGGTNIPADAAVKIWHDDAGGNLLYARLIGMVHTNSTGDILPFLMHNDDLIFEEPPTIFTSAVLANANLLFTVRSKFVEVHKVTISVEWTPDSAGDTLAIRDQYSKDNASFVPNIKAHGIVAGVIQMFEIDIMVGLSNELHIITDTASVSTVTIRQIGYRRPSKNTIPET